MSASNLTAFTYIAENSLATPGLWNSVFSQLSQNIAEANTLSVLSGGLSLNTQGLTVAVDSTKTDYLFLNDTSGQHANYVIGSFSTSPAAGLNIMDASAGTMIVSFSKQSVRFFQNIVGPVFDIGGALANTLNAATFGVATQSVESRIQAAVSQATASNISRVYIPQSMLPYSVKNMSLSSAVLMVREGGSATGFDVKAYGAQGSGTSDDTPAFSVALLHAFQTTGEVFVPHGIYAVTSTLTVPYSTAGSVSIRGEGVSQRLTGGTSGDPIGNYGSRISIVGSGKDIFFSQITTANTRQYFRMEALYLQGNTSGGTGHGVYLSVTNSLSAILCTMRDVVVNGTAQHGLFLEGNVFESGFHDCIFAQCGDRGIKVSASGAILPTEIHFDRVSCVLNNVGLDISGGGTGFVLTEGSLLNSTGVGLLVNGSQLIATGLALESNGSVFARFVNTQDCVLSGCVINYASSSTATGLWFGGAGGCLDNVVLGFVTNGAATNTDLVIADGNSQHNHIIGYSGNATFQVSAIDNGVQDVIQRGSQFSGLFLGADGVATNPTFAFLQDQSVGIYRSGASAIGFGSGTQLQPFSGTAGNPSYAFSSESSLGWYRSAVSTIAQSYGTFAVSTLSSLGGAFNVDLRVSNGGAIRRGTAGQTYFLDLGTVTLRDGDSNVGGKFLVADGSSAGPTLAYGSETALGWYRSGSSTIAPSYGTLNLATGAVNLSMTTLANATSAVDKGLAIVFRSSGVSLVYKSGSSIYVLAASTTSGLA